MKDNKEEQNIEQNEEQTTTEIPEDTFDPVNLRKPDILDEEKTEIKERKSSLTIAIISVIIIMASLVVITFNVIDIRLNELSKALSVISKAQEGNKSLHMLVRYFQATQKISATTQQDDENNNLTEVAMATVLPDVDFNKLNKEIETPSYIDEVTYTILDGIRFLIGKSKRKSGDSLLNSPVIQKAYIYERKRDWDNALKLYNDFVKNLIDRLTPEEKAFVDLHLAFCKAQKSEFKPAIADLNGIIKTKLEADNLTTGKNDTQEVAIKLKNILESLLDERERIQKETDLLKKGKEYYDITDYKNTIITLELFKNTINQYEKYKEPQIRQNAIERADFYLARAYEELGKSDKSAKIYTKLIKKNSKYSEKASQRMIMMGTIYNSKSKIVKNYVKKQNNDKNSFLNKVKRITQTENELKKTHNTADSKNFASTPRPTNILKQVTKSVTNVKTFTTSASTKTGVTKNITKQKQVKQVKIQKATTNTPKAPTPKPKVVAPKPAPKPKVKAPAPKPKVKTPAPKPKVKAPAPKPAPVLDNKMASITKLEQAERKIVKIKKTTKAVSVMEMEIRKKSNRIKGTKNFKKDFIYGIKKSESPNTKGYSIIGKGKKINVIVPRESTKEIIKDIPIKDLKESK